MTNIAKKENWFPYKPKQLKQTALHWTRGRAGAHFVDILTKE
ncbi:hypothetical protein [Aeromonas caviae]